MTIFTQKIKEIEQEAKTLGILLNRLCKDAKINNSTMHRWRSGETEPRYSKWNKFLDAFDKLKAKAIVK